MAIELRVGAIAKQQGLTIKALAERAEVAYNTAHALYTGRALRIDLDTLNRLCHALDVEPGEILVRSVQRDETPLGATYEGSYEQTGERTARSRDHEPTGSF